LLAQETAGEKVQNDGKHYSRDDGTDDCVQRIFHVGSFFWPAWQRWIGWALGYDTAAIYSSQGICY
jgi:hypothetical protein